MSFCWYNNREHITRNWKMNEYVESSSVGFSLELTFFKCLSNKFSFSDVGFYNEFCFSNGFCFSSVLYDQYDISSVCLRQLGRELRKVVLPTPIEPKT